MVAGQVRAQLGQPALSVRVAVEKQVDGPPEQTHQPVAAPVGCRADTDELLGQLAPLGAVAGPRRQWCAMLNASARPPDLPPAGLIELGQHPAGSPLR